MRRGLVGVACAATCEARFLSCFEGENRAILCDREVVLYVHTDRWKQIWLASLRHSVNTTAARQIGTVSDMWFPYSLCIWLRQEQIH